MVKDFLCFFLLLFLSQTIMASSFYTCKSKYALCTTAACQPIPGKKDLVSCDCKVFTGYSVGQKQCEPVKKTQAGDVIHSRYYPIKRYAVCKNERPWAWCLDKPCVIDKDNPQRATCACSLVSNQGAYIIVTEKKTKETCTTGIISSATLTQSGEITNYLRTQPHLKPFPITVVH